MEDYNKQAEDFCKKHGVKIYISKVGEVKGFPNEPTDKYMHNKYDVRIIRKDYPSKKMYTPFYDSAFNYGTSKRPSKYDILADLSMYINMDDNFERWAYAYGYGLDTEEDVKRAKKVFYDCQRLHDKVNEVFSDCLDDLSEIC